MHREFGHEEPVTSLRHQNAFDDSAHKRVRSPTPVQLDPKRYVTVITSQQLALTSLIQNGRVGLQGSLWPLRTKNLREDFFTWHVPSGLGFRQVCVMQRLYQVLGREMWLYENKVPVTGAPYPARDNRHYQYSQVFLVQSLTGRFIIHKTDDVAMPLVFLVAAPTPLIVCFWIWKGIRSCRFETSQYSGRSCQMSCMGWWN